MAAGLAAHGAEAELRPWQDGAVTPFALPAVGGPPLALEASRGRPVLVHFFATWCEPCKEELPALHRLAERIGRDRLQVLAISVGEVELRVQRFLASMPLNFPVLLDGDRAVAKAWKVSTLPSSVILDARLAPRLIVETGYPWDRLAPHALIEMLGATNVPQSGNTIVGRNGT